VAKVPDALAWSGNVEHEYAGTSTSVVGVMPVEGRGLSSIPTQDVAAGLSNVCGSPRFAIVGGLGLYVAFLLWLHPILFGVSPLG